MLARRVSSKPVYLSVFREQTCQLGRGSPLEVPPHTAIMLCDVATAGLQVATGREAARLTNDRERHILATAVLAFSG